MLLANDNQRVIGIKRIAEIKREYFPYRKNIAQETFDKSPPHMRKTICFHAGLKSRHVNMTFAELSYTERQQVVAALNSFIEMASGMPRLISNDDCALNNNH